MPTDRDDDFAAYAESRWVALVRSAVLLGCARADAEDLVQTALLRAWTSWPRVRRAEDPDAYVYRILVNALATSRRRRWWGERPTERTPEVPATVVDDPAAVVSERDAVVRALAGLSAEHREVLVLRYVADLGERATAEALGVAPGTVKSRTARALAALDRSGLRPQIEEGR